MVTGYVMKAQKASDPNQTVYWAVVDNPDFGALLSDYDPTELTNIAVDYTFETTVDGVAGSPSGFAGGDLAGQYPNPKVVRINGRDLSADIPTDKYVLSWNDFSKKWEPKPQNAPEFLTANRVVTSNVLGKLSADIPLPGKVFSVFMEQPAGSMAFIKLTEDMIDPALAITCDDINLEVGQSITNPQFSVSYNRSVPVSANVYDMSDSLIPILDASGNSVPNINGMGLFKIARTFSSNTNISRSFKVNATDGYAANSKQININWMHKFYYGTGDDWASLGGDPQKVNFIKGSTMLPVLTKDKSRTINVSCDSDKYIYYAYPASFGDVIFSVSSVDGGFDKIENAFSMPNAYVSGLSEPYCVWRSINSGLGNVQIVVR